MNENKILKKIKHHEMTPKELYTILEKISFAKKKSNSSYAFLIPYEKECKQQLSNTFLNLIFRYVQKRLKENKESKRYEHLIMKFEKKYKEHDYLNTDSDEAFKLFVGLKKLPDLPSMFELNVNINLLKQLEHILILINKSPTHIKALQNQNSRLLHNDSKLKTVKTLLTTPIHHLHNEEKKISHIFNLLKHIYRSSQGKLREESSILVDEINITKSQLKELIKLKQELEHKDSYLELNMAKAMRVLNRRWGKEYAVHATATQNATQSIAVQGIKTSSEGQSGANFLINTPATTFANSGQSNPENRGSFFIMPVYKLIKDLFRINATFELSSNGNGFDIVINKKLIGNQLHITNKDKPPSYFNFSERKIQLNIVTPGTNYAKAPFVIVTENPKIVNSKFLQSKNIKVLYAFDPALQHLKNITKKIEFLTRTKQGRKILRKYMNKAQE